MRLIILLIPLTFSIDTDIIPPVPTVESGEFEARLTSKKQKWVEYAKRAMYLSAVISGVVLGGAEATHWGVGPRELSIVEKIPFYCWCASWHVIPYLQAVQNNKDIKTHGYLKAYWNQFKHPILSFLVGVGTAVATTRGVQNLGYGPIGAGLTLGVKNIRNLVELEARFAAINLGEPSEKQKRAMVDVRKNLIEKFPGKFFNFSPERNLLDQAIQRRLAAGNPAQTPWEFAVKGRAIAKDVDRVYETVNSDIQTIFYHKLPKTMVDKVVEFLAPQLANRNSRAYIHNMYSDFLLYRNDVARARRMQGALNEAEKDGNQDQFKLNTLRLMLP